jgi:hypothetical protein
LHKKNEESKDDQGRDSEPQKSRSSATQEVAFQPMDLYLHSIVRNMVDKVSLYEAKVEETKRLHNSEDVQTARSDEIGT